MRTVRMEFHEICGIFRERNLRVHMTYNQRYRWQNQRRGGGEKKGEDVVSEAYEVQKRGTKDVESGYTRQRSTNSYRKCTLKISFPFPRVV